MCSTNTTTDYHLATVLLKSVALYRFVRWRLSRLCGQIFRAADDDDVTDDADWREVLCRDKGATTRGYCTCFFFFFSFFFFFFFFFFLGIELSKEALQARSSYMDICSTHVCTYVRRPHDSSRTMWRSHHCLAKEEGGSTHQWRYWRGRQRVGLPWRCCRSTSSREGTIEAMNAHLNGPTDWRTNEENCWYPHLIG